MPILIIYFLLNNAVLALGLKLERAAKHALFQSKLNVIQTHCGGSVAKACCRDAGSLLVAVAAFQMEVKNKNTCVLRFWRALMTVRRRKFIRRPPLRHTS